MLEIYKENLYDLLIGFDGEKDDEKPTELKIKENPRRGIYIEGLIQIVISDRFCSLSFIKGRRKPRRADRTHRLWR